MIVQMCLNNGKSSPPPFYDDAYEVSYLQAERDGLITGIVTYTENKPAGVAPYPRIREGRRWQEVAGGGRRWQEVAGGGRRWQEKNTLFCGNVVPRPAAATNSIPP